MYGFSLCHRLYCPLLVFTVASVQGVDGGVYDFVIIAFNSSMVCG